MKGYPTKVDKTTLILISNWVVKLHGHIIINTFFKKEIEMRLKKLTHLGKCLSKFKQI